jgi:hypothetical protein
MKLSLFFVLLAPLLAIKAHPQGSAPFNKDIDTLSTKGTITGIKETMTFGIERRDVTILSNGKTTVLYLYLPTYETDDLLNKKVSINYVIIKRNVEIDMLVNDTSVYYDRTSPKNVRKASRVKGVFDIYDYGCVTPGRYSITSPKGDKTWISHYVEEKYQTPYEGNNVIVYYSTETNKKITEISFIETPSTNKLNIIPAAFFKQTGISRFEIATKEKNFNRGCVRKPGDKHVLLNYVKTNEDNNTQVISLSFGGKRFYTKEYHLSYRHGKLRIKEKEL